MLARPGICSQSCRCLAKWKEPPKSAFSVEVNRWRPCRSRRQRAAARRGARAAPDQAAGGRAAGPCRGSGTGRGARAGAQRARGRGAAAAAGVAAAGRCGGNAARWLGGEPGGAPKGSPVQRPWDAPLTGGQYPAGDNGVISSSGAGHMPCFFSVAIFHAYQSTRLACSGLCIALALACMRMCSYCDWVVMIAGRAHRAEHGAGRPARQQRGGLARQRAGRACGAHGGARRPQAQAHA
jgi:hypothetical protein